MKCWQLVIYGLARAGALFLPEVTGHHSLRLCNGDFPITHERRSGIYNPSRCLDCFDQHLDPRDSTCSGQVLFVALIFVFASHDYFQMPLPLDPLVPTPIDAFISNERSGQFLVPYQRPAGSDIPNLSPNSPES